MMDINTPVFTVCSSIKPTFDGYCLESNKQNRILTLRMANQLCWNNNVFKFICLFFGRYVLSGTIVLIMSDPYNRAVCFYSSDVSVWRDYEMCMAQNLISVYNT